MIISFLIIFVSCDNYYKDDYYDNSPTSGKLNVYHSEGLQLHVKNQALTFEALYSRSQINCYPVTEQEAIKALLDDSCKAIIIDRLLDSMELKAFQQKKITPRYSPIAKTGIAFIINQETKIKTLTINQIKELLSAHLEIKDSTSNILRLNAIIAGKNSAESRYLLDSVLHQNQFGPNCYAVNSTLELIDKIANSQNNIGILNFAWLSDKDDLLYKKYKNQIKFISIGKTDSIFYAPNQSSFKTGEYPFIRTIYYLRTSDEFSLAKGFEAFEAGPKGQLTFLKQGLLPIKQAERSIQINMEPIGQ